MEMLLERLGRTSFRRRKAILILWAVIVVFSGVFASQLPSTLKGSGFTMDGSFEEVNRLMEDRFGLYPASLLIVFEEQMPGAPGDLEAYTRRVLQQIRQLELEGLATLDAPFDTPGMAKDSVAYANLGFDLESKDMKPIIAQVRSELAALQEERFRVSLTGAPVIEEDLNTASQRDLAKAEMIGLPIALLILLLAFGGLVAAGLPVAIGVISVSSSLGMLYFVGLQMELSIFLLNVVVMVGLALGIDFALLFVNRFRLELENGTVEQAVVTSVRTAGEAIIFSGFCVMVGLSGMLFIRVDIFKAVAFGGMAVVFFSVLAALTLLPALLAVLGSRVNRLMLFKVKEGRPSLWLGFSRMIMKRPAIMTLLSFALLIALVIPVKEMDLKIPDSSALPLHYESRYAYERYEETFHNKDSALLIMIIDLGGPAADQQSLETLQLLQDTLHEDPMVTGVDSIFSMTGIPDAGQLWHTLQHPEGGPLIEPAFQRMTSGELALLQVHLATAPYDNDTKVWIREWEEARPDTKIGGYAKFNQEIFDEIMSRIGYGLLLILASTYVILFAAFRSVLIPLKAILMNGLSLCATFGLLVWIFQGGHFGIEPVSIALFIPIFIFSIVFGLSMDYEVFLISRIQEIYRQNGDNDRATLEGLALTSKIISSAAAIMIVITGAFAFTGVMPVKQMGVGIALAIFIDATIVRMVLVPSMMKLMGRWNWWAPRLFRR